MKGIIRIDDRLIHGQVTTGWGSFFNPKYIILADDDAANDDFLAEMYLLGVPSEYTGKVLHFEKAVPLLKSLNGKDFICVVKSCRCALQLYQSGYKFDELNIGGLRSREDKKEFCHYVFVDENDMNYLKELKEAGVRIYIQDLPSGKKFDYNDLLRKVNF